MSSATRRVSDKYLETLALSGDPMACELLEQRESARYRRHLSDCHLLTEYPGPWGSTFFGDRCTCGYSELAQHLKGNQCQSQE